MEYRHLSWKERGFESEQEEIDDMREYVQTLMVNTGPPDIADSLLIIANVCDNRALLTQHAALRQWYQLIAAQMRDVLNKVCVGGNPKPNAKFENAYLYMPDMETMH